MPRAVYSVPFLTIANTTGLTTHDIPAGDVAIVKNMTLWVRDDHPTSLGSAITVALDDPQMIIWDLKGGNLMSGVYMWSGWQVFSAHMFLQADAFAYSFRASGTLLTPT